MATTIKTTTLRVNSYWQGKLVTSRVFHPSNKSLADWHARHITKMGFVAEVVMRHYPNG